MRSFCRRVRPSQPSLASHGHPGLCPFRRGSGTPRRARSRAGQPFAGWVFFSTGRPFSVECLNFLNPPRLLAPGCRPSSGRGHGAVWPGLRLLIDPIQCPISLWPLQIGLGPGVAASSGRPVRSAGRLQGPFHGLPKQRLFGADRLLQPFRSVRPVL